MNINLSGQKVMIKLEAEEAEALYGTKINTQCPVKYYDGTKKVWWVIHGENDDASLPYTICQDCYHEGRFGEKDASVKKDLKAVMLVNLLCNCDGRKLFDGFPISFGNGWFCGIYSVTPYTSLLKTDYNYEKDVMCMDVCFPFQVAKYAICLYTENISFPENIFCEITDDCSTFKANVTANPIPEGGYNIMIHNLSGGLSGYNFVFDNTLAVSRYRVKVYDMTEDLSVADIVDAEEPVKKGVVKSKIKQIVKGKKTIKESLNAELVEKIKVSQVDAQGFYDEAITAEDQALAHEYGSYIPLNPFSSFGMKSFMGENVIDDVWPVGAMGAMEPLGVGPIGPVGVTGVMGATGPGLPPAVAPVAPVPEASVELFPPPLSFSSLAISSNSPYGVYGPQLTAPMIKLPNKLAYKKPLPPKKINKKLLFEFDITPRHIDDPPRYTNTEPEEYTEQTVFI
ncbi:MAG: hypothetical protein Harvfovirus4_14 [Harvfovirus sp.]|uniref:Uncharacterized protein n=1 Tax=Harvfovirus sp. TaxID=2487768 RepID=A0A3G5A0J4_9VIRU|nr:MAG: hypothetical protein Harvfovirus4_14 [Harvfovirus sp.]